MSPGSELVQHQTARRATGRAPWFETAICCRFWLRVSRHAVPESPVFSSGSREDPPLVSTSKVAQNQLRLSRALCRRQARFTSSLPCIIARLPDYPAGMVRESSGVIKGLSSSIGKQRPSKRTRMCIRSLHRIAQSSCCLGHETPHFYGRSETARGRLTADRSLINPYTR
jgi:hypothetical protein